MNPFVADLAWYASVGLQRKMLPRCSFASVHLCPRYYQSVALLGRSVTTGIEPTLDKQLLVKWSGSDLWPVIREQETGVTRINGEEKGFDNFCPEVTGETFGVFALHLHRYTDALDYELAHERLGRSGAAGRDWRWSWASAVPLHYSDCPIFAPLSLKNRTADKSDEIFELKPGAFGMKVNLKALLRVALKAIPPKLRRLAAVRRRKRE